MIVDTAACCRPRKRITSCVSKKLPFSSCTHAVRISPAGASASEKSGSRTNSCAVFNRSPRCTRSLACLPPLSHSFVSLRRSSRSLRASFCSSNHRAIGGRRRSTSWATSRVSTPRISKRQRLNQCPGAEPLVGEAYRPCRLRRLDAAPVRVVDRTAGSSNSLVVSKRELLVGRIIRIQSQQCESQ
jgi:hypothetical protein